MTRKNYSTDADPFNEYPRAMLDEEIEQDLHFEGWLYARKYSDNTIHGYKIYEEKLKSFLGDNPLTQQRLNHFVYMYNHNVVRSFIKAFIQWYSEEVDPNDPDIYRLRVPKIKGRRKKKLPNYVTAEELNLLVQSCVREDVMAYMVIMFEAGLRTDEAVHLKKQNIDFLNCALRGVGKGNKEFEQPISRDTTIFLQEFTKDMKLDKHIFPFGRERGLQLVKELGWKVLGRKIGNHTFRHGSGTHMLRSGLNLVEVQKHLRHAYISTTEVYVHIGDKETRGRVRGVLDN